MYRARALLETLWTSAIELPLSVPPRCHLGFVAVCLSLNSKLCRVLPCTGHQTCIHAAVLVAMLILFDQAQWRAGTGEGKS